MHWNGVDRVLREPRPDTYQTTQVHDGGEHDPLNGKLLDAMQQDLSFRTISFNCLLFEEFVEVGIATVGI